MNHLHILRQLPGNFLFLSPDSPDFTILEVTDAYAQVTLTERDQIMGKKLFDIFPDNPNDPETHGVANLRASLIKVISTEQPDEMPIQKYDVLNRVTGLFEERYWKPVNKPVLIDGSLKYIIHSVEDITENKNLKLRENYFRSVADETPFMIWRCVNGNCNYVNKSWTDFTGMTVEESMGKGFIKAFHPDDLPEQSMLFANAMQEQKMYETKYRLIHKDGSYRYVFMKAIPQNNDYNSEFIGSITDITNEEIVRRNIQESELQFRRMADSIVQMIWVTDPNGMHEYYNQRWYDFTGATVSQTEGEGWNEMFHPDDRDRAWEKWRHSLATGDIYEIEYRLKNAAGEYVWVLGRAAPFYDAEGKILKWFGTCTDINEQKILQHQKEEFISVASHELKTPITSLSVSVQIIEQFIKKDKNASAIMIKMVETANLQIKKLSKLVNDLLNATKIEQGQLIVHKTSFDLAKLLKTCADVVLANEHEIIIHTNSTVEVNADELKIEQVVINLINNAIKYAPSSKKIDISLTTSADFARVSIKDYGPGVTKDKIPFLFDRYYRADNKGNQYSGLGLGLYICNQIIKIHKGDIGVISSPEGSEFWFSLPL